MSETSGAVRPHSDTVTWINTMLVVPGSVEVLLKEQWDLLYLGLCTVFKSACQSRHFKICNWDSVPPQVLSAHQDCCDIWVLQQLCVSALSFHVLKLTCNPCNQVYSISSWSERSFLHMLAYTKSMAPSPPRCPSLKHTHTKKHVIGWWWNVLYTVVYNSNWMNKMLTAFLNI